jgi:hypothetical protein
LVRKGLGYLCPFPRVSYAIIDYKQQPLYFVQMVISCTPQSSPTSLLSYSYILGLTENLMRTYQSEKTYIRWRERVHRRSGMSSKHGQLTLKTSTRQKQ